MNILSPRNNIELFLPCNMAAMQNLCRLRKGHGNISVQNDSLQIFLLFVLFCFVFFFQVSQTRSFRIFKI